MKRNSVLAPGENGIHQRIFHGYVFQPCGNGQQKKTTMPEIAARRNSKTCANSPFFPAGNRDILIVSHAGTVAARLSEVLPQPFACATSRMARM